MPVALAPGQPPVMFPLPRADGALPEAGGVFDQGAWLGDVMDVMAAEDARLLARDAARRR